MASNFVIVSIKLCLNGGNDEDISLYKFGGLILSGFKVIEGEGGRPPGGRKLNKIVKKPGLNRFSPLFLIWSQF